MPKRSSAKNSRMIMWVEEDILQQKVNSLQAEANALAAELVKLEKETKDLSNKNAELKKLYETMVNHLLRQDARNDFIKLEIQWLKMITSNPAMASKHFRSNPGHAADLLPNLQGHEHGDNASPGLVGESSSAAGGNDALPQCTGGVDHSLDDPSENNGLAEGSGEPADPAATS